MPMLFASNEMRAPKQSSLSRISLRVKPLRWQAHPNGAAASDRKPQNVGATAECIVLHNFQLLDSRAALVVKFSHRARQWKGLGGRGMDYAFDIRHQSDDQPYEVTSFAKKYGLTIPAADAVLFAKGPSRTACDAAALAFLCAIAAQAKKQSTR